MKRPNRANYKNTLHVSCFYPKDMRTLFAVGDKVKATSEVIAEAQDQETTVVYVDDHLVVVEFVGRMVQNNRSARWRECYSYFEYATGFVGTADKISA